MKLCKKCGEVKPRSEFYKEKSKRDGLQSHCKLCCAARRAAWRAANLKKDAAYQHAYKKANSDKVNAIGAKRRAAKLQATPQWLTQQHLDQIEALYRQAALMKRLGLGEFHVDHIIPLQGAEVRGLHVPWNLQVLPASQNRAKSNRLTA